MRLKYIVLVLLSLTIWNGHLAKAQCAAQFYGSNCTPANGGSCSGQVLNFVPGYSGIGLYFGVVECCGTQISGVIGTRPGLCQTAFLGTPEMLKRLDYLSKSTDLLIASCDGYVRHFHTVNVPIEQPDLHQMRNLVYFAK